MSVPPYNTSLEDTGAHDLGNLWQHHFRVADKKTVRTIVTTSMMNLVPMDAPHPLYSDEDWCTALRVEYINDQLVETEVDHNDPAMAAAPGVVVTNRNGKELKFRRPMGSGAPTSINDVPVTKVETLSDGTIVYVTGKHLFNWQKRVDDAFKKLLASKRGGGGGCQMRCGF